jgi:hypothetical protein
MPPFPGASSLFSLPRRCLLNKVGPPSPLHSLFWTDLDLEIDRLNRILCLSHTDSTEILHFEGKCNPKTLKVLALAVKFPSSLSVALPILCIYVRFPCIWYVHLEFELPVKGAAG